MIAMVRRRRRTFDAPRTLLGEFRRRASPARPGSLDRAIAGASHVGRGGVVWLALAPLIGSGRRSLSRREATLISASAIGAAYLASIGVARIVGRPRPCARGARPLIPCPTGGSFPSDQAAAAFAAAGILGWFEPRTAGWFHGVASALAISRVAARVHYPSDVTAGAAIGVASGRVAARIGARRASASDEPSQP